MAKFLTVEEFLNEMDYNEIQVVTNPQTGKTFVLADDSYLNVSKEILADLSLLDDEENIKILIPDSEKLDRKGNVILDWSKACLIHCEKRIIDFKIHKSWKR